MNKITLTIIAILAIAFVMPSMAQQLDKQLEKELTSKTMKIVRKEVKSLKKDGYYVAPGALPMDIQLENAWKKQIQTDETGYPKYIVATGNSVAETQTAAKIQATETAKVELAGTIATNVAALIENNIANEQLSSKEAASVTKTIAAGKNLIAQELGMTMPLVELYREIGKNNVEASIRLAYDTKVGYEKAKQVMRKSLDEETDLMQEKLDRLMDF